MKPTMEILARINENSNRSKEEVFTKLYRYLLRPDIYYEAYRNLYANRGAATKGIKNDTADGFSKAKIAKIIKELADETYKPTPVRRTYIRNKNNPKKERQAIYEPVFLNCSHGFRPNRSCHTALSELKREFTGARWFVEGDIKGCFDNIDHAVLVSLINSKIKDARLIKLIHRFMKAGYVEDWRYYGTYSGTPQGGIISPILANIYLHELDKFVMKQKADFDVYEKKNYTPEYRALLRQQAAARRHINESSGEECQRWIYEYKRIHKMVLKTPAKSQTDKKIKYIRYADDFLMEYSCLRTLANKHKSSVPKMIRKYKDGNGRWGIPYETKQGLKRCYFAKYADSKNVKKPTDKITYAT